MSHDNIKKAAYHYFNDRAYNIPLGVYEKIQNKLNDVGEGYYTFWNFINYNWSIRDLYKNYLLSEKVWNEFISTRIKAVKTIKVYTGLEIETFYTEFRVNNDAHTVLMDIHNGLNPLFRYLMAEHLELSEVSERFKESAIYALKEEPLYFSTLVKFKEHYPIRRDQINEP